MKQFILKTIRKLGYELVKTKPSKRIVKTFAQPYIIEFIGVPGVGKTTLYYALIKQYPQIGISLKQFKGTLNNFSEINFRDTAFESAVFYQEIVDRKINNIINNNYKPFDKIRVLQYFYSVILNDKIMSDYNDSYVIITEEGLMHNFSSELSEVIHKENGAIDEFNNRIIIHCYSSPEIIARQIIKRVNEGGHLLPQHKNLGMEALIETQKQSLEKKKQFAELLKKKGVPVIDINTSHEISENVREIKLFIEKELN